MGLRNKKLVEAGDNTPAAYRIIGNDPDKLAMVEILDGRFAGVKLYFGSVAFDDGIFSFTTQIVYKPWGLFFTRLKTNKLFTIVTGNILRDMILKSTSTAQDFLVG